MNKTLWSPGAKPDQQMLDYTVGDDRTVDTALLRWDVLGSLGHVESLTGGGIISGRERDRMRKALRAALGAVSSGDLTIGEQHEDGHSAVEFWLTDRFGEVGEQIHAGRSRNDQVALDLRLFMKDATLGIHHALIGLVETLLDFAAINHKVVWPGYTHQRIAMPSSAGAWAAGLAELLLDAGEAVAGCWPRLDRSPLGTAAGYGVPLPLDREAAATALGFSGVDQVVTAVQAGRGQLEAAVLAWCLDIAHPLTRLASDVILYSSEEFGWLVLPANLSTGSSIMPQKRNPDLFELTRGRAAMLSGDHATVMAVKSGMTGGYHRDYQLLKAPTIRGLIRCREMLEMMKTAVGGLAVNRTRAAAAMRPEAYATDEAMRLVNEGVPFRQAYRQVAERVKNGETMPVVNDAAVLASRRSTGGLGNLGVNRLLTRRKQMLRWNAEQRGSFDKAMSALAGRRTR